MMHLRPSPSHQGPSDAEISGIDAAFGNNDAVLFSQLPFGTRSFQNPGQFTQTWI